MASISFSHIQKTYPGQIQAVDDFSLEVEDKEFIVLVGPSGCGKTTTLRMVAGLEDITGGELRIGDATVNNVPAKSRDIAMVFQNYALYPHMSVYDNMAFALNLRKIPKTEIQRRVNDVADVLDIRPYLKRRPKALSGGQRQRVALGRAMVRDPAVFLLDEPLSNLDAKLRASMRVELVKLHKRLGATFLYVTHDQTEAMTMGDRIVVMKDGLIQQVDTPQNLYRHPASRFVAGFIGTPQMNFIQGVLARKTAGHVFQSKLGILALPAPTYKAMPEDAMGKTLFMGVRPEDICVQENSLGLTAQTTATIDVCEQLGNEAHLYLQANGQKLVARVPADRHYPTGKEIAIDINMENIHFFDAQTGQNVFQK